MPGDVLLPVVTLGALDAEAAPDWAGPDRQPGYRPGDPKRSHL